MQKKVRLRLTILSTACALLPFLGAGAATAQTATDDPAMTARATDDSGGKTPDRDATGPRGAVPGGFADWKALFSEQTRLNGVADRLTESAENADGYGGIIVAPENHEVRLYWRGTVPPAVQTTIDQGRQTAPVTVLPAAYTNAQLLQEADKWAEAGQASGAAPQPDGSGIRLSVTGQDTDPQQLQRPSGTTAPITLEKGEEFSPAYSRQDDVPSYYAGGRTWNQQSGAGCSSGFAVYDKYGTPGFLTAAHCGNVWDQFYDGGGISPANHMGQLSWRVAKRDAAIVLADATANVFDGSSTASTSNKVVALWKAHVGNFVCNSGATLGENCLIKVTETGWSGTYTNGQYVKHMVRAKSVGGGCAVAHGDSGGPVYSYTNWFDEVAAQGITSAVSKKVYCGAADGGSVIIFSRVWDVDLEFGALLQVW
ncbi:S1 family peptidase [Nonomuraea aurantiaca]|uniref:S1 family peptidase n=1 Tax=Nonomuraea aurantiaca TaxID=2878562 RepID=UPI001CD9D5BF|nr:S1 family peptidase [Nonomuraea aurantiaca]MCA2224442.1 S1 family peptidase [Nonomuraea aurantiaca]